jgi:transposase
MNLHLAEIAKTVAPGAHAVLLVDQAGWHMSTRLAVPPNITIIALPPKSPELNPVENVWQFMRDNWLSNRVFKSYDDLVDHCGDAWNKLTDQPLEDHVHRIAPVGARVLINGTWYYGRPERSGLRLGWGALMSPLRSRRSPP